MSHDLSPLGFRKTPFTRELQVRERQRAQPGTVRAWRQMLWDGAVDALISELQDSA